MDEIVEERSRIGDRETDLIVAKNHKGVALTLTERKSRSHCYALFLANTLLLLLRGSKSFSIRRYLPKERNLKEVSMEEEAMIMDKLNLRPRKCLDFTTPYEVFFGYQPLVLTT